MAKCFVGAFVLVLVTAGTGVAQDHTIVALSHRDFTVYELDPVSGKTLNSLKAVNQPHEGAITPDGGTMFVSVPSAGHVLVIDGDTFKERARIETELFRRSPQPRPAAQDGRPRPPNTSASPHAVALTADGSKLYIGVENADVPGLVVYDVKSGKVTKKIDLLLTGGHYFDIQPATGKLYYPHREDNRVVVVDTKTDKVVRIIPVKGGPRGVDFAPNGEVWLHQDNDGTVAVVDSRTDEVIKVIQTEGKGIGRVAVSPDGRFAVSTHQETRDVAIIDAERKEVVTNIRVGLTPGPSTAPLRNLFPLFSPDSSKLYVMNPPDGDVVVIDTKAWKIVARHKVGVTPFGGGVRLLGRRSTSEN
ncbi:MAG: hypothetical protein ACRD26_19965 [Vicinamibacterales bacterium]